MSTESIIQLLFEKWESGDYHDLPYSEDFRHTSPHGTIESKVEFLKLIDANRANFTGFKFEILDKICIENRATVRYRMTKTDFSMDISEWFYIEGGEMKEIISYYNT